MPRTLLTLVLFVHALSSAVAQDDKKGDPKLDGTWIATSWQRGGGEIGKDKVNTELVISKNTYEYPKGINRISKSGTIKFDAAKGTIDFTPEDGPSKGKTLLGIYKVEADKLTLCFTVAGMARPKDFKSNEKTVDLATYERKK